MIVPIILPGVDVEYSQHSCATVTITSEQLYVFKPLKMSDINSAQVPLTVAL